MSAGPDNKEPLVGHDMLAVGNLHDEYPLRDLGADIVDAKAGLFQEFADCACFERLAILDLAAGRRPEAMARERALLWAKRKTEPDPMN